MYARILALCLALCCIGTPVFAQFLPILSTQTSGFPRIEVDFQVVDSNRNVISTLTRNDITIRENGQVLPVTSLQFTPSTPGSSTPLSVVFTLDISGSMRAGRMDIARNAAIAATAIMSFAPGQAAVTSFDDRAYLNQDLTTDRTRIISALNSLQPQRGTNYNAALLDSLAGALPIAARGINRRVVIFLTDGLSEQPTRVSDIVTFARANNITIHCVVLGLPASAEVRQIAQQTGGQLFENINDQGSAESAFARIVVAGQGSGGFYRLVYDSPIGCDSNRSVAITIPSVGNIVRNVTFTAPRTSIPLLQTNTTGVSFFNAPIGVTQQTVILTAPNRAVQITGITQSGNNRFSLSGITFPRTLNAGESVQLTMRFTATTDSSSVFAQFAFQGDNCPFSISASISYSSAVQSNAISIVTPNGGERFVVGRDSVITWSGLRPTDTTDIAYSTNNGRTWTTLSTNATGSTSFAWRNIPAPATDSALARVRQITSLVAPPQIGQRFVSQIGAPLILESSTDGTVVVGRSTNIQDTRLWIINPQTGQVNRIITLDVSAVSTMLEHKVLNNTTVMIYDINFGLSVVDLTTGARLSRTTFTLPTGYFYFQPSFGESTFEVSPDRRTLIVSAYNYSLSQAAVFLYNMSGVATGTVPTLISTLGTTDEQPLGFANISSVTDSRLALISRNNDFTQGEIKVWDYVQRRLLKTQTFNPRVAEAVLLWNRAILSPDGSEILFTFLRAGAQRVEIHPAIGDNTTALATPYSESLANIFPIGFTNNGQEILVSRRSSTTQLDSLAYLVIQRTGNNTVLRRSATQVLPRQGARSFRDILLQGTTPNVLSFSNLERFIWQWTPSGTMVQSSQPNQVGSFMTQTMNPAGTHVALVPTNGGTNTASADSIQVWNALTGARLWSRALPFQAAAVRLSYTPNGATLVAVVIAFNQTVIITYDATTGNEIRQVNWTTTYNPNQSDYTFIAGASTLVYCRLNDNTILGVNILTGQQIYSVPIGDFLNFVTQPRANATDVFIVTLSGRIIAFNALTGTLGGIRTTSSNIRALSSDGQLLARGFAFTGQQEIVNVNTNTRVMTVVGAAFTQARGPLGVFSWDGSKYASITTDTNVTGVPVLRYVVHTYDLRRQILMGRTVVIDSTNQLAPRHSLQLSDDGTYVLSYSTGMPRADVIRLNLFSQPEAISANVWSIVTSHVLAQDIDMGSLRVGNRKDSLVTVFVRNPNTFALPIDSLRLSGTHASEFSLVSGIPPYTLNPGETRGIEIRFAPTAAGVRTAQLQLFARGATTTATIRGTGVVPNLFPQVRDLDLGDVVVGSSTQATVPLFISLTTSTINIRILRMSVLGQTDQFTIQTGNNITVAPGQSIPFQVRFDPIRTGRSSVILRFETDDPDNPIMDARITGTGTRTLQLATVNYDFGNVVLGRTASTIATLFVSLPVTTVPATIRRMTVLGATDQFTIQNTSGSIVVQPRASIIFPIQFAPIRLGQSSATLRFETDDPDNPIMDARITGTGTRTIGVQTTNFDFGGVLVNSTTTATANLFVSLPISTTSLTVSAVIDGGNQTQFTLLSPTRATVVGIGQSLPVQLRFTPNLRTSFTSSVLFTVQEDGSQYRAQITGLGVLPSATLQSDTLTVVPGQEITIPIRLGATLFFNQITENTISVQVRFNASALQPIGATPQGRIVNNTVTSLPERVITLDIPRSGTQNILQTLQFKAALGNTTATAFILENARVASGNADIQTANGLIRFAGLNQAGGTRLYWTEQGRIRIQSVSPNPVADQITLRITAEESESVSLSLVNMIGTTEQILWQGMVQAGENTLDLVPEKLPQGMYSLILRTAHGYRTTVPVMIVR